MWPQKKNGRVISPPKFGGLEIKKQEYLLRHNIFLFDLIFLCLARFHTKRNAGCFLFQFFNVARVTIINNKIWLYGYRAYPTVNCFQNPSRYIYCGYLLEHNVQIWLLVYLKKSKSGEFRSFFQLKKSFIDIAGPLFFFVFRKMTKIRHTHTKKKKKKENGN